MIRSAATLAVTLLLAATCSAQQRDRILLYGTFTFAHAGTVSNNGAPNYDGTAAVNSPDLGVGATFNLHHFSAATLGLDVRLAFLPSSYNTDSSLPNPANMTLFLVGMKVAIHPPTAKIKPYVQLSVGLAGASTPDKSGIYVQGGGNRTTSWGVYEALGGIDYALNRRLSLRVVEIGGGHGSSYDVDGNPGSNTSFLTASTGLVIHF